MTTEELSPLELRAMLTVVSEERDECVTWRRPIAAWLLDRALYCEYLERRVIELESDLSVARAGIPRGP